MANKQTSALEIDLIILGVGTIGCRLLELILERHSIFERQFGVRFSLRAATDSQGSVTSTVPMEQFIKDILECKRSQGNLSQPHQSFESCSLSDLLAAHTLPTIIIDTTATFQTINFLRWTAVPRGAKIVLANKEPLTNSYDTFQSLQPVTLFESTVAAGTPVCAVTQRLLRTGEFLKRIHGSFSGTLGYVTSELERGIDFSVAVRKALELGFTEPDPRKDLSGHDVARKVLILARMMGIPVEMHNVEVESLYPAEMESLSLAEFMEQLPSLDESFRAKVAKAKSEEKVLRYVGTVDDETGEFSAALVAVSCSSALGSLQGSDNLAAFYTESSFSESPLVVRGAGAGTDVTCLGLLSDILEHSLGFINSAK